LPTVRAAPIYHQTKPPTPAVNSADVDDEAMAAIGQRVVAEAPCVALEVVAEEQVFEAIIPVVPIALAPQRGLVWWYIGAALTVLMYHDQMFKITLTTNRQYDFFLNKTKF
jgi:hypothetical protein